MPAVASRCVPWKGGSLEPADHETSSHHRSGLHVLMINPLSNRSETNFYALFPSIGLNSLLLYRQQFRRRSDSACCLPATIAPAIPCVYFIRVLDFLFRCVFAA